MEETEVTALLRTQGWEDASIRIDPGSGRASVLATLGGERWLLRITEARCMDGVVRQFLTRLEQVYRGDRLRSLGGPGGTDSLLVSILTIVIYTKGTM